MVMAIGLFAAALSATRPALSTEARRVALVIGNANYPGARLAASEADAKLIASTLQRLGFELVGGKAQIDLTKTQFKSIIEEFAIQARGSVITIFYYAGHGLESQEDDYLIPVDASHHIIIAEDEFVRFQKILTMLNNTSGFKIAIIDACRENPWPGMIAVPTQAELERKSSTPNLGVAYSTSEDRDAFDRSGYARYLAESLMNPKLDLQAAFANANRRVSELGDLKQYPHASVDTLPAGIYLGRLDRGEMLFEDALTARVDSQASDFQAFKRAFSLFKEAVALGNTDAMTQLGFMYEELYNSGYDRKNSISMALSLYIKAANLGNADAMNELGYIYMTGNGVNQNYAQALQYLEDAVRVENVRAMINLAYMYMHGWGIERDYVSAYGWYKRAADRGSSVAMCQIGLLYKQGHGPNSDPSAARNWFSRCAQAGNPMGDSWINSLGKSNSALSGAISGPPPILPPPR